MTLGLILRLLKVICPRLFSISTNKLASVSSLGFWDGYSWQWNFSWAKELRPQDRVEKEHLMKMLNSVCPAIDHKDEFIWAPQKSGQFWVKSYCHELAKLTTFAPHAAVKGVWKGFIPYRIKIFTWTAILRRINTKSRLASVDIIPSNDMCCILCGGASEDVFHLLLHCDITWRLWQWWIIIWGSN